MREGASGKMNVLVVNDKVRLSVIVNTQAPVMVRGSAPGDNSDSAAGLFIQNVYVAQAACVCSMRARCNYERGLSKLMLR